MSDVPPPVAAASTVEQLPQASRRTPSSSTIAKAWTHLNTQAVANVLTILAIAFSIWGLKNTQDQLTLQRSQSDIETRPYLTAGKGDGLQVTFRDNPQKPDAKSDFVNIKYSLANVGKTAVRFRTIKHCFGGQHCTSGREGIVYPGTSLECEFKTNFPEAPVSAFIGQTGSIYLEYARLGDRDGAGPMPYFYRLDFKIIIAGSGGLFFDFIKQDAN